MLVRAAGSMAHRTARNMDCVEGLEDLGLGFGIVSSVVCFSAEKQDA